MADGITAVITVYNGADLVRRAIESVLAQSHPADEFIVVDDGSTDGTGDIVRGYGSRLRYVHQKNSGVAAARNRGIHEAATDWIAFLDHDDEWLPHKLEVQTRAIQANPGAALCYSAYWRHALDGGIQLMHLPLAKVWPMVRLHNPFPPSVVVLRKPEALQLGGFKERLKGASCEDWELFVRCLAAYPAVEVAEPLANYYEIETGGSRNYRLMLPNTLSIVDDALLVGLQGVSRALWRRRIRSVLYYGAAISARDLGDPSARYLLQSFREWPFPDVLPKRWKTALAWLVKRSM